MTRQVDDIRSLIERNRTLARTYADKATAGSLVQILKRAEVELNKRINSTVRLDGGDEFKTVHAQAILRQLSDVLKVVKPAVGSTVIDTGKKVSAAGVKQTADYMRLMEGKFHGIAAASALRFDTAMILDKVVSGTEASQLRRLEGSGRPGSEVKESHPGAKGILQRYGDNVMGSFEEQLRLHYLARRPWDETRELLIQQSPFLMGKEPGSASMWAERILRTETAFAQNRSNLQTMVESNEILGDGIKILCASFDDRTSSDSYAVHGQIRRLTEPFDTWTGSYMHPPARPNDREVVIPHRLSWPIPAELKPKTDGEVAARWTWEKRKGSPPARPKLSTIEPGEFGKQQPLPVVATSEPTVASTVFQPPLAESEVPVVRAPPPSVEVGGVRLPKLGKGMEWSPETTIPYEAMFQPKPEGLGLVPWKLLEDIDIGRSSPTVARALQTLRRLKGGSYQSGYGPVQSLGFAVPKNAAAVETAIGKTIDRSMTMFDVAYALRDKVPGVTKQQVRLDDVSFTRAKFDLFATRTAIRESSVKEIGRTNPILVKHEGKLYVLQGGEQLAADRLLGRFEAEAIVIEAQHPKPLSKADFIKQLPTEIETPEQRAQLRNAVRGWFANDGINSRDIGRFNPEQSVLEHKELPTGIGGYHHWTGKIEIDTRGKSKERLQEAITRLREGRTSEFHNTGEYHPVVVTLLHEEAHGSSPCTVKTYQGVGVGLEEATTELYARAKWRELIGLKQITHMESFAKLERVHVNIEKGLVSDVERAGFRPVYLKGSWEDHSYGAYPHYITTLYKLTHDHTGLSADLIPDLIDKAIVKMRQGPMAGHDGVPEFVRSYVDALDGLKVGETTVSMPKAKREKMVSAMLEADGLKKTQF